MNKLYIRICVNGTQIHNSFLTTMITSAKNIVPQHYQPINLRFYYRLHNFAIMLCLILKELYQTIWPWYFKGVYHKMWGVSLLTATGNIQTTGELFPKQRDTISS